MSFRFVPVFHSFCKGGDFHKVTKVTKFRSFLSSLLVNSVVEYRELRQSSGVWNWPETLENKHKKLETIWNLFLSILHEHHLCRAGGGVP